MAGGYFQVRRSLFSSTVWLNETPEARCLWIWILGEKNKRGFLDTPVAGMAHLANISLEATEAALARFQAPDLGSRTETNEGRRLEKVKGGWMVLNHTQYDVRSGQTPEQVVASADSLKETRRLQQKERRERSRLKPTEAGCNQVKLYEASEAGFMKPAEVNNIKAVDTNHTVTGESVSDPSTHNSTSTVRSFASGVESNPNPESRIKPLAERTSEAIDNAWMDWPHNPDSYETKKKAKQAALLAIKTDQQLEEFSQAAFRYSTLKGSEKGEHAAKTMKLTTFLEEYQEWYDPDWKYQTEQYHNTLTNQTTPTDMEIPEL